MLVLRNPFPILAFIAWAIPAQAQVPAIQTQDLNTPGFVAELIEAKRSDGVLSLKVRLKNTGTKAERISIYHFRNSEAFYVQAASKKHFMLTDSEKVPLTA